MSLVLQEKFARLRFDVGVPGVEGRTGGGVLVWDDVPVGALVHAFVDRPTELNEPSDGGQGAPVPLLAPYRFDLAPVPGPFSVAGVLFNRSRQRVLVVGGGTVPTSGMMIPIQRVPQWVVFAPVVSGALAQKGRTEHAFQMPGTTSDAPDLDPQDRRLLRLRWTGTPIVGESQDARLTNPSTGAAVTPNGSQRTFSGSLLNRDIVPGSVRITATVGGASLFLDDNGDGRVVGVLLDGSNAVVANGDGVIDYREGTFRLKFGSAAGGAPDNATSIIADYEHGCSYLPLDVHLAWDSRLV